MGATLMLAITGILLLVVSAVVFRWTLGRGSFRRYPYEQFLIVGASAATGLWTVLHRPSAWHIGLFAVELVALVKELRGKTTLYLFYRGPW